MCVCVYNKLKSKHKNFSPFTHACMHTLFFYCVWIQRLCERTLMICFVYDLVCFLCLLSGGAQGML